MNRCLFCGEVLTEEGKCPNIAQHFKPMCFNCLHMGIDGEDCVCCNEDNKNDAIQKIMSSFDGGYQITGVSLKPLPLKDPAKKCKRHALNYDAMTVAMKNMF